MFFPHCWDITQRHQELISPSTGMGTMASVDFVFLTHMYYLWICYFIQYM